MPYTNWNADTYAKASDIQFWQAMEALTMLNLKGDEIILDVGCGDGKVTALLAEKVPNGQVVGIDITPNMIAYANSRFKALPNLSFKVMSADALEFSEVFDHIVSFSCLHWVADQNAVWQGFHRALKPMGQVVTGFQADHEHLWHAMKEVMANDEWSPLFADFEEPYHHFTLKEMQSFIQQAGFYLARSDEIHQVEFLKTLDGLTEFLQNWVPQFRYLPESQSKFFRDEVIGHYLSKVEPIIRQQIGLRIKRYIFHALKVARD